MHLNEISRTVVDSAMRVQRPLGPGINFNVVHLRDGIRRMVSGDPPSVSSESSVVISKASSAKQVSWPR
jgi:hypothetical protein